MTSFQFICGDVSLKVKYLNGKTAQIHYANVLSFYAASTGNIEERRNATRSWIRESLLTQLGEDTFYRCVRDYDFDQVTGYVFLTTTNG